MLLNLHRNPNTFHFNINKFKSLLLYALKKEALSPKKTCHLSIANYLRCLHDYFSPFNIYFKPRAISTLTLYALGGFLSHHPRDLWRATLIFRTWLDFLFCCHKKRLKLACSFGTHFTLGKNHKKCLALKAKKFNSILGVSTFSCDIV